MSKRSTKHGDQLKQIVRENAEGGFISIPQWASFILFASQIAKYPVFYVGPASLALCVYLLERNQADLHQIGLMSALVSMVWLCLITYVSASRMKEEGTLMAYMSILVADTKVGQWLFARVGTKSR